MSDTKKYVYCPYHMSKVNSYKKYINIDTRKIIVDWYKNYPRYENQILEEDLEKLEELIKKEKEEKQNKIKKTIKNKNFEIYFKALYSINKECKRQREIKNDNYYYADSNLSHFRVKQAKNNENYLYSIKDKFLAKIIKNNILPKKIEKHDFIKYGYTTYCLYYNDYSFHVQSSFFDDNNINIENKKIENKKIENKISSNKNARTMNYKTALELLIYYINNN